MLILCYNSLWLSTHFDYSRNFPMIYKELEFTNRNHLKSRSTNSITFKITQIKVMSSGSNTDYQHSAKCVHFLRCQVLYNSYFSVSSRSYTPEVQYLWHDNSTIRHILHNEDIQVWNICLQTFIILQPVVDGI